MKTLTLNVYDDKGNVTKTFTAETFKIKTGTVVKLIRMLGEVTGEDDDLDNLDTIVRIIDDIKPILKTVFRGITDDDLENTDFDELLPVTMDVIRYSFDQIKLVGDHKKKQTPAKRNPYQPQTGKKRYYN